MSACQSPKRAGFSLLGLIVVIGIIALLIAILVPVVQKVREAAARTQTNNNLKQLSLGLHSCNDVFKRLPPAFDKFGQIQTYTVSVHVHLMPYIEQDNLYKQFAQGEGKGDAKAEVPSFLSPLDPSTTQKNQEGIQNFAANLRVFADKGFNTKYNENMKALAAVEPGTASIPRTFVDGTSNTISFVTKYGNCGEEGGSRYAAAVNTKYAAFFGQNAATMKAHPSDAKATFQLYPDAKQCLTTPLMGQSFRKHGISVGMFDGSVRLVSPDLSAETWNRAVQPNDKLELGKDWE